MLFDFASLPPNVCYKLLVSTVTPRPIAWVVSQDPQGTLNAAPFSFFNALGSDPPVVAVGIGRRSSGSAKDTRSNVAATGEFVVNLVSEQNAAAMNVTAIDFDPHIDELAEAGLTTCPSVHVKPPRIAESPVALECTLVQIIDLPPATAIVLGRVVAIHVRDDAVLDGATGAIDTPSLGLIGRMHGAGWYARTSDRFEMPRMKVADWKKAHADR
jgi:flavin reductase (DIM6/NTAB) family NADH-FMN oxidoreductase RutF